MSSGGSQSELYRRRLLGTVATATSVAVAGCSSSNTPLRVPEVTVENFRETSHAVAVELHSADAVVFEATVDLPPAEARSGKINDPSGEMWRPEAAFDSEATLRYRIDSGEWQSVTLGDDGNECIRPQIELRSGGRSVVGRRYECFGTE